MYMYSNSCPIPSHSSRVLVAVRAAPLSLAIAPHPHTSAHTRRRAAAVRHMASHRVVSYRIAAQRAQSIKQHPSHRRRPSVAHRRRRPR